MKTSLKNKIKWFNENVILHFINVYGLGIIIFLALGHLSNYLFFDEYNEYISSLMGVGIFFFFVGVYYLLLSTYEDKKKK